MASALVHRHKGVVISLQDFEIASQEKEKEKSFIAPFPYARKMNWRKLGKTCKQWLRRKGQCLADNEETNA